MFVQMGEKTITHTHENGCHIYNHSREVRKDWGKERWVEPQACLHELDTLGRSPSLVCSI